jgi:L-ascorbate metabolism protein UlaG (beta-lactamase superfamily)
MSSRYLKNDSLPFIRADYLGNELVNNRFVNPDKIVPVGFSTVLKWMFSKNPQRKEKKQDTFRPEIKKDSFIFDRGADAFNWLGHASFIIRIQNHLFLTDPCLRDLPGTKRLVNSPFSFEELAAVKTVLFTHTHRDHYDVKSVRALLNANPDLLFYVPLRMGKLLSKLGAKNIVEAGWYQQFPEVDGVKITFLPARHWNRRFTHDTNRELWGSFMLQSVGCNYYFAGDTSAGNHFSEIANLFSSIDYVFMPIAAYKPSYMMKDVHLNPQEAIEAFTQLKANCFVPMHYGTYDLADEPISEPIRFIQDAANNGALKNRLIVPAIGQTVFY